MRGISFERFSRSQREIEGAVESSRKKSKLSKESERESKPKSLRTPEEVAEETEGLVSARTKKKTIEVGGKKIKEGHLEIEEEIVTEAGKKKWREEKQKTWEESMPRRGHRRGHKPTKVERTTIREETDIEDAA